MKEITIEDLALIIGNKEIALAVLQKELAILKDVIAKQEAQLNDLRGTKEKA